MTANQQTRGAAALSDEELARALQEEFEAEERRQRQERRDEEMAQQLQQQEEALRRTTTTTSTAAGASRTSGRTRGWWPSRGGNNNASAQPQPQPQPQPQLASQQQQLNGQPPSRNPNYRSRSSVSEQERRDEALARSLQQQTQTRQYPITVQTNNNNNNVPADFSPSALSMEAHAGTPRVVTEEPASKRFLRGDNDSGTTQSTSSDLSSSDGIIPATVDDEDLARRLQQEMRDEALARQIITQEQQAQQQAQQEQAARLATQRPPARRGRCLACVIPLVVVIGVAVALYLLFGSSNGLPNLPSDIPFIGEEDPFGMTTPGDAYRWSNNGNGLQLEILNALEDHWQHFFFQAMTEWDNGQPDVLTLATQRIAHETACEPKQGKLKVCNGNYGGTRWRGINQVLLQSGNIIIASAARMNEFYLSSADGSQKQYTMCHEIGHGFGLPHTDENFFNKDLGNCMDYTNNPEVNKSPDESNFQFLFELYGQNMGGGQNRRLGQTRVEQPSQPLPESVLAAWRDAAERLENVGDHEEQGIRLLHKSQFGEAHEMDIGNGFVVQSHKLLPL